MNGQNRDPASPPAKRRFLDLKPATPTFIGAESVIMGDIRGRGQFVVSGEVHGDGDLRGGLTLAVTGIWNGHVHADEAIVAGRITGSLTVLGKLEIGFAAIIRGKVIARSVAIAKGAIVDGEIEITSGAPVHEFEEQRARRGTAGDERRDGGPPQDAPRDGSAA
jgi:cytoskeletal protein CcmA (bactofilin family)